MNIDAKRALEMAFVKYMAEMQLEELVRIGHIDSFDIVEIHGNNGIYTVEVDTTIEVTKINFTIKVDDAEVVEHDI